MLMLFRSSSLLHIQVVSFFIVIIIGLMVLKFSSMEE